MDDLISRAAAIAEVMLMVKAHEHEIFRGEMLHYTGIKAMLEAQPAVDAIPVEWLRKIQSYMPETVEKMGVDVILMLWQKEQEAK